MSGFTLTPTRPACRRRSSRRIYSDALLDCLRYWEKVISNQINTNSNTTIGNLAMTVYYKQSKRVVGTVSAVYTAGSGVNTTPNLTAGQLGNIVLYHGITAATNCFFTDDITVNARM